MECEESAPRERETFRRWLERVYGWPPVAWESITAIEDDDPEGAPQRGGLFRIRHLVHNMEVHVFSDPGCGAYVTRIVQFASDRGYPVSPYLPGGDGARVMVWEGRAAAVCRTWGCPAPAPVHRNLKSLFSHLAWWHRVARGPTPAWPRTVAPLPEHLAGRWRRWIDGAPERYREVLVRVFVAWQSWISDWDIRQVWCRGTAEGTVVSAFRRVDDWADLGEGTWWLRRAWRCRPGAAWEDAAGLMIRYGFDPADPRRWETWLQGYREVSSFPDEWKRGIAALMWSPEWRLEEEWMDAAARWSRRIQQAASHAEWFEPGERQARAWRRWADRVQRTLGRDPAVLADLPVRSRSGDRRRRSVATVELAARHAPTSRLSVRRGSQRSRVGEHPWLSLADPALSPAGEHRDEHDEQHH
ncbi:MAG: hypothetical protein QJR01_02225 [Kyrpidia sp.]|nr:hypothetical protein [Kyrpidia sp.]